MKNIFFPVMAAACIGFCAWIYVRNGIWTNRDLFPSESILIYSRDSSSFYILLRIFFLAMWGWGIYCLWTIGRASYLWSAVIFYVAVLFVDNLILGSYYQLFVEEKLLEPSVFPPALLRGISEAFFTLVLNAFVVLFLKHNFKRRQRMEIYSASPSLGHDS